LEKDIAAIARHEPTSLAVAAKRQDVLRDVTSNAKDVFGWSDSRPEPRIRLEVLAALHVSNEPVDRSHPAIDVITDESVSPEPPQIPDIIP
jgi:hypothetical protein